MNETAYRGLHHGAAWIDWSGRGKIRATGEDRVRLMHAMTTNHIQDLPAGRGCYAFFLNSQGRILGDAYIFVLPEYILIDTEPESKQRIFEHLDKFIIADDVTLEDVTAQFATIEVAGAQSEEVLRQAGAPVRRIECGISDWDNGLVARVSYIGGNGFTIFIPAAEKDALIGQLQEAGAVAADPETVDLVRLEHHAPRYGLDFTDTWIPQETQQMQAVHFAKGCYLGQEIVERVRARGHLNKMLVPVEIQASEAVPAQTRIKAEGRDGGYVTSSAYSPRLQKVVAFAMLRTDAFGKDLATADGTPVTALNVPAATSRH